MLTAASSEWESRVWWSRRATISGECVLLTDSTGSHSNTLVLPIGAAQVELEGTRV
ncbi:MAG TPA: hypothetical protein PLU35_11995 [Phycisphaerales bacterium]|nr:hypothetical protein [Phycisphaerales bacterium]